MVKKLNRAARGAVILVALTVDNLARVVVAPIRERSGHEVISHPTIAHLRNGQFRIVDRTVSGDAPKDFLQIYEHGRGHKARVASWPQYIAKIGHKWYPNESITEHLLTRIGQILGIPIADSRLMFVRGQLRFLSRYFLKKDESLVHGAEIFAGHLGDLDFVKQVEQEKMSRDLFTFQVVEESLKSRFPEEADKILTGFVRMLGFDALVGNNDRHYFNWGVITDLKGNRPTRFAPVYDTARALFWDGPEAKFAEVERNKRIEPFLLKYAEECMPKTGWDGARSLNHFGLVRRVVQERPALQPILKGLVKNDLLDLISSMMGTEFAGLFSDRRRKFVLDCLNLRQQKYVQAVT